MLDIFYVKKHMMHTSYVLFPSFLFLHTDSVCITLFTDSVCIISSYTSLFFMVQPHRSFNWSTKIWCNTNLLFPESSRIYLLRFHFCNSHPQELRAYESVQVLCKKQMQNRNNRGWGNRTAVFAFKDDHIKYHPAHEPLQI